MQRHERKVRELKRKESRDQLQAAMDRHQQLERDYATFDAEEEDARQKIARYLYYLEEIKAFINYSGFRGKVLFVLLFLSSCSTAVLALIFSQNWDSWVTSKMGSLNNNNKDREWHARMDAARVYSSMAAALFAAAVILSKISKILQRKKVLHKIRKAWFEDIHVIRKKKRTGKDRLEPSWATKHGQRRDARREED